MTIDTVFEDDRWQDFGLEAVAQACLEAVCQYFCMEAEEVEAAVLACDDERIQHLNAEFRAKDAPTNVLSWPSEERATPGERPLVPQPDFPEMGLELGDIAISYDTCEREANDSKKDFADHVRHLLVHGLLHLMGYDHISDKDAQIMEQTETEILASLGVSDPY